VTDNFTLLSQECEKYDIVIIDGPAHTSKLTVEIAKFSNLVIQPSGATIADLYTSVLEFNTLLQEGIDKNKLLIVLNQIHSEMQEKKAREYLQQTNYQVLNGSLPSKVAYCTAQDEGKAITEVNYPTLKFRAQDIIREIITFLQNHA
jgi:chromosome partitioning protein